MMNHWDTAALLVADRHRDLQRTATSSRLARCLRRAKRARRDALATSTLTLLRPAPARAEAPIRTEEESAA